MRIVLLSSLLLFSPWAGQLSLLQDILLGCVFLLSGYTFVKNPQIRENSAFAFLFLLFSSALFSCMMNEAENLNKVMQIGLFCSIPIFITGINKADNKWIVRTLLAVAGCLVLLLVGVEYSGHSVSDIGIRNDYIPAVLIAVGIPFLLLDSGKVLRRAALFLMIIPVVLPFSICLALILGLGITAVLYVRLRSVILTACIVLLVSLVTVYACDYRNIKSSSKNDLVFFKGSDVSQKYAEIAAAVKIFSIHPILGVGGGHYQANIGQGYGLLPKSNQLPDGGQSGWLVIAVEYGLAGLGAIGALFVLAVRKMKAESVSPESDSVIIAAGTGLLVLCLCDFVTVIFTREIGPVVFTLLGMLLCQPTANNESH